MTGSLYSTHIGVLCLHSSILWWHRHSVSFFFTSSIEGHRLVQAWLAGDSTWRTFSLCWNGLDWTGTGLMYIFSSRPTALMVVGPFCVIPNFGDIPDRRLDQMATERERMETIERKTSNIHTCLSFLRTSTSTPPNPTQTLERKLHGKFVSTSITQVGFLYSGHRNSTPSSLKTCTLLHHPLQTTAPVLSTTTPPRSLTTTPKPPPP